MPSDHLEQRPQEQIQENLIALNVIQDILESDIGSYAIQNAENLFDVETNEILRKLEFSRGLKTHLLVLAPDTFIRALSSKFPSALLQEIHNALLGFEILSDSET